MLRLRKILRNLQKYSFFEMLNIIVNRIYSKNLSRRYRYGIGLSADLSTDLPNDSTIKIGKNFFVGKRCRIETIKEFNGKIYSPNIIIGNNVTINDDVHIGCNDRIIIGDRVLLASKIYISDHNHGNYSGKFQDSPLIPPNERALSGSPITIEEDVWIGEMVSILPGVKIGKGSIIGSNSVVTKDIPEFCIAVGVPARVIKRFDFTTSTWINAGDSRK